MYRARKTILTAVFIMVFLSAAAVFGYGVAKAYEGGEISPAEVSGQTVSGQTVSGQVISGQTVSGQTVSGQVVSGQAVTGAAVTETAAVETARVETGKKDMKIVETTYGRIKGKKTSKAYVWLGVPYGKTKRWQAPKAPDKWTKTKLCKKSKRGKGDNCLFLNVYRPLKKSKKAEKRPVMVFLHGGGNAGGTANRNFGKFVKDTDVIVVSVEFRQGAFGWFTSRGLQPDNSLAKGGNFAMLDIRLALKWVKANIEEFGGDSANVTLAGFSAGARDVLNCMLSPVMKGLFHKVISFSGGMTTCSVNQGRKWSNRKLAQVLVRRGKFSKTKKALKYVKRISKKKLNRLLNSLTDSEINRMTGKTGLRLTDFPQCFRDGRVIPKGGFERVEWGGYSRMPMLIGTNQSEFANVSYKAMSNFLTNSPKNFKNRKQFYKLLRKAKEYGSQLQSSFYLEKMASKFSVDPYHAPIYAYRFSWGENKNVVGRDYAKYVGAIHGMDVDFLLGRYAKGNETTSKDIYNKSNARGRMALTGKMRQYISNFLYTGNPNGTDADGKTLSSWKKWGKAGTKRIMTFSATKKKAITKMTARYINRAKCKRRMKRSLTKKSYKLFRKRILNDRFFMQ